MARLEGIAGEQDSQKATKIRRIIAYVVLIVLVVMSLLPFYMLLINATRPKVQPGVRFIPDKLLVTNFKKIFSESYKANYGSFLKAFRNSVIVAGLSTVLSIYFSALTAYAIHVYDFRLKKAAHTFILIIMMVPTQASAIGLYEAIDYRGGWDYLLPRGMRLSATA